MINILTYRRNRFFASLIAGLCCMFICLASFGNTGDVKLDSLLAGKTIGEQIELLNENALILRSSNAVLSKMLAYKALSLSEQINDTASSGRSLRLLGDANYFLGYYDSSITYYSEALINFKLINDLNSISRTLNNMGVIFWEYGNLDSALVYFEKSLELKQTLGDTIGETNTLQNIGSIYKYQGKITLAKEIYDKALEINKRISNLPGVMDSHINIGELSQRLRDYPTALINFRIALEMALNFDDRYSQAICLNNIGDIYFRMENYAEAQNYIIEAYYIRENLGDRSGMVTSLINISKIYERESNFARANEIYIQALELANELGQTLAMADIFASISHNLRVQGFFGEALHYTKLSMEISLQADAPFNVLMNLKEHMFIYAGLNIQDSANSYLDQYMRLYNSIYSPEEPVIIENEKAPMQSITEEDISELDDIRQSLTLTWIISIIIITGLIIFIYLLMALLITRHKQRRKFYNKLK